jgi:AcrR family transcriptional regulator
VGHREDLLAGAKKCLYDKGYARTTARDIVAASGTNLASIGYHYGSKEALMTAALFEAIEEWGDELGRATAAATKPDAPFLERFEAFWRAVIDSLGEHRGIHAASFEVFAQIDRVPEIHEFLKVGIDEARKGFAEMLGGDEALGALLYALMAGVLVQWLVDPDRAPSAAELTEALRRIAGKVTG